jgi:hypothetical protein
MRLVRNTTTDGMCKYSLIEHQKGDHIEHGLPGTENEFFVLKLKDKHAYAALVGYLESLTGADEYDDEYALDLQELARRAGPNSPWCKEPD